MWTSEKGWVLLTVALGGSLMLAVASELEFEQLVSVRKEISSSGRSSENADLNLPAYGL